MIDPKRDLVSSFIFIQPHLNFGGAENQTLKILNALVARGHSCTLILHSQTGGLLPRLDPRVKVIGLGFQNHTALLIGAFRLIRILKSLPASLVVTRLWSSILMVGSISTLVTSHKYVYYEDLDPSDHEQYVAAGKLKKRIITRIFRRNQGRLIANTKHVAKAMQEQYRLDITPRVIECGVDVKECQLLAQQPITLPPRGKAVRVVTVGSLIPIKGLLDLQRNLSNSEIKFQWVIVGDGPLRVQLEKLPRSRNLSIVFVGASTNPYPYMAQSDLLLHGALSESFGLVIVEALSLGLPVLARAANGPQEIKSTLPEAKIWLFNNNFHIIVSGLFSTTSTLFSPKLTESTLPLLHNYELSQVISKWEIEGAAFTALRKMQPHGR